MKTPQSDGTMKIPKATLDCVARRGLSEEAADKPRCGWHEETSHVQKWNEVI